MHIHSWKQYKGSNYKRCLKCGKIKQRKESKSIKINWNYFRFMYVFPIFGALLAIGIVWSLDISKDGIYWNTLIPYTEEQLPKLGSELTTMDRVRVLNMCFTHGGVNSVGKYDKDMHTNVECNDGLSVDIMYEGNMRDVKDEFLWC